MPPRRWRNPFLRSENRRFPASLNLRKMVVQPQSQSAEGHRRHAGITQYQHAAPITMLDRLQKLRRKLELVILIGGETNIQHQHAGEKSHYENQ